MFVVDCGCLVMLTAAGMAAPLRAKMPEVPLLAGLVNVIEAMGRFEPERGEVHGGLIQVGVAPARILRGERGLAKLEPAEALERHIGGGVVPILGVQG